MAKVSKCFYMNADEIKKDNSATSASQKERGVWNHSALNLGKKYFFSLMKKSQHLGGLFSFWGYFIDSVKNIRELQNFRFLECWKTTLHVKKQ